MMGLASLWSCTAASILGLLAGVPAHFVVRRLPQALERMWAEGEGRLPPISVVATDSHSRDQLRLGLLCLLSAAVALIALLRFGVTGKTIAAYGFGASLLVLAFIDAETGLLPDLVTLPLAFAGLMVNAFHVFVPIGYAIIGMAVGAGALWLVHAVSCLLLKREGMGLGDLKLLGAVGAWVGFQAIPQILLVSFVSAALYGAAALMRSTKAADDALPFGPFLVLASLLAMFAGTAPI